MLEVGERAGLFRLLIRDRDIKYAAVFEEVFTSEGVEVLRSPPRALRANAYARRWVRWAAARRVCLDWMLVYNPRRLQAVLGEFVRHDNEYRPHQSLDQRPRNAADTSPAVIDLVCVRVRRGKILND